MVQCPTCGSNVAEEAEVCPDCGMDLKEPLAPPEAAPETLPEVPSPPVFPEAPREEAPSVVGAASLTLKRGGVLTSHRFEVGERIVVGRFDPDSGPVDMDLGPLPEAAYVSRHHAEIWRDAAGQWFIKDLGARNGTFVRAAGQSQFQRVTGEQAIQDGDEIALGNARFEFRVST